MQQEGRFSPSHLRALRTAAGLSRTALAFKVDRSHAAVEYWETGRSQPRAEFVPRIATVLGCRVDELYELVTAGPLEEPGAGDSNDAPAGEA